MKFLDTKRENADEKVRIKTLSLGVVVPDVTLELAKNNEDMYLFSPYDVEKVYGVPFSDISVTEKYLSEQVKKADGMPAYASKVRRLNFCQWTQQATIWITPEQWAACGTPLSPAGVWAAIEPLPPGTSDTNRTLTHQVRMRFHPEVTMDTKIEYVDPDTGVITTLASSTYVVGKLRQQCGLISRGDGQAWPQTARRWDAVRITIVAGFNPDALPYEIQQALLITTGAIDRTRGDDGSGGGGRLSNTVSGFSSASGVMNNGSQNGNTRS